MPHWMDRYKLYYPQEQKGVTSLFWFGLGFNIFAGNVVAITQQSLWCARHTL